MTDSGVKFYRKQLKVFLLILLFSRTFCPCTAWWHHRHRRRSCWVASYSRGRGRQRPWGPGSWSGSSPSAEPGWRETGGQTEDERSEVTETGNRKQDWWGGTYVQGGSDVVEEASDALVDTVPTLTLKQVKHTFRNKQTCRVYVWRRDSPPGCRPEPRSGSPAGGALSPQAAVAGSSHRWTD